MSSSVTRRYLRLHSAAVHPLLSVLVPMLFLQSADQILRALLPGISFFPRFVAPLLLAAGIEQAALGNLLFRERASFAARLRELFLLLLVAFGILFLLLALKAGLRNSLSALLVYPLLLTLLQWLISNGLQASLRDRELLLRSILGKQGSALRHSLRDSSYQAGISMRSLRLVLAVVVFFQALVFALLSAAALLKRTLSFPGSLAAALHALSGLLFIGLLEHFREEQLLLGQGVAVPLAVERRRVFLAAGLLLAAAAAAGAAARNASLLPLAALIALLEKLASLFRFRGDPALDRALERVLQERRQYYDLLLRSSLPAANAFSGLVAEFLRRLVVTLSVTGLFLFLVSPLLSKEFTARLKELKPLRALIHKLKAAARLMLRLWLRLARWPIDRAGRRPPPGPGGPSAAEEAGLKPKEASSRPLSLRKRAQMGRVLRAFLSLIRWGEGLGVPFYGHHTPQEITGRLAAAVPAGAERLDLVVEVFEEAMFSTHLLPRDRLGRYFASIRGLRRLNRRKEGAAGWSR